MKKEKVSLVNFFLSDFDITWIRKEFRNSLIFKKFRLIILELQNVNQDIYIVGLRLRTDNFNLLFRYKNICLI